MQTASCGSYASPQAHLAFFPSHSFFAAAEDSGVEDEECLPPPSYRENMGYRRKSVFAESYDPTAASEPYEKASACYYTCMLCITMHYTSCESKTLIFACVVAPTVCGVSLVCVT